MGKIDKLILRIQQHEHEGFWMILIAFLGIVIGYSSNVVSSILEILILLTSMICYVLICLRLLYRYIQPKS